MHLSSTGLTIVDSADAGILLVEPRALNIGLLLRIILLRVNLTDQVGNLLDALFLLRAKVMTSKRALSLLELGSCFSSGLRARLTKVVPVLSAEVASIMASLVSGDDGSETLGSSLNGSVNEGELSNVVLVDHAEDGLLLADVDLRVANLSLVGSLEFSEAIITDEVVSFLLGFTVDRAKRGGKST